MVNNAAAARGLLVAGFALMLGAATHEARAGACQEAGLRASCVESNDIARDSLRSVDVSNESEGYFALGKSAFKIPKKDKVYARVDLTPPTDGFVIITGSANITAGAANDSEAQGTVTCSFKKGRPSGRLKRVFPSFSGSANKRIKAFDSIAWSTVEPVKAEKAQRIALVCKPAEGPHLNILSPAITVVFHAQEY